MKLRRDLLILLAGLWLCSGCSGVSSTARRAALTTLGTAAGGAAGYAAGGRDAGKALAGAVVGAGLTQLALGEDPDVKQAGFDAGYVQGQSDAIKRQYFLRLALESRPPPAAADSEGEVVHYVLPGPEVTADGRKLEPHNVVVRVVE